jgi:hypothetical protein
VRVGPVARRACRWKTNDAIVDRCRAPLGHRRRTRRRRGCRRTESAGCVCARIKKPSSKHSCVEKNPKVGVVLLLQTCTTRGENECRSVI